jgi:transcriptional regulator with XRE-family HTH domain
MADTYPIRFPAQLRQHLRALRKKHGLTQANVAALIGVSQARIAEIEANPGLVSFEQIMQLLAALSTTITLCDAVSSPSSDEAKDDSQSETSITKQVRILQRSGTSNRSKEAHKTPESVGGLDQARRAFEGSHFGAARKALDSLGGLDQARKALEASGGSDAARKALDSLGSLDQARKALGAGSGSDAARKALDSLGSLDQARKALAVSSGSDAARKALDSLGGLDQARKALEGLEQARKALEVNSGSEALRNALGDLDTLQSYRNLAVHPKKGNW